MSEETDVGPSMASGSQVCSGNCADFAKAASARPTAARYMRISFAGSAAPTCRFSSTISKVPARLNKDINATRNPTSPIRYTMYELILAKADQGRVNKNQIIRKKDQTTN